MTFENYIIRLPELTDAPLLFELVQKNKARLIDYFPVSVGAIRDIDSTHNYLEEKMEQAGNKEGYTYIIFDKKELKPIGVMFVKSIDWRIPKAELAYYIDKDYEGKGIVSKALGNVIDHCFKTLKINKLFLRVAPGNIGSKRVAEKNGFTMEGTLRNDFKKDDGTLIDILYYGLVRK